MQPEWRDAMKRELDAMEKCKAWKVVERPISEPVVSCRWVFTKKANGVYKARLVARGFELDEWSEMEGLYSPVVSLTTIRILLALVNK